MQRLVAGVSIGLTLGLVLVPATSVSAADEPAPRGSAADADPAEPVAAGIIVRTSNAAFGSATLRSAERSATEIDVPLATASPGVIDARTMVISFDQPQALTVAQTIVSDLEQTPGVVWAEPDLILQAADVTLPNDPLFSDQWSLWQGGGDDDMSVRAPRLWGFNSGDPDVVIAVIDTGVAAHPDLAGRVIDGYDFVTDIAMANDGDAWDPNPSDPGDWVSRADIDSGNFPAGCRRISQSSWHGTHVAGIAAAQWNNDYGVSGAAPNVTVQNVRGLGKCGGTISDIAAAIRWAAGDTVLDPQSRVAVPVNPTPAQVINLSLGGASACTRTMADAVLTARLRGAVVVAAAGNDSAPVSSYIPANCPGVVAVAATDKTGARASYSNFGMAEGEIFLAAPGGGGGSNGILSTANTGATTPQQPDFDMKSGTSMATPLVSAAVALIVSAGETGPEQIEARLARAVRPFPVTGGLDCSTISCGAGLLSFDRLMDSISLSGERAIVRQRPGVKVDGVTLGLPQGERVTPFVRLPGQTSYQEGVGVRSVSIVSGEEGEFSWQRRTGKRVYVYFRAESGEQSKRIIIPANKPR